MGNVLPLIVPVDPRKWRDVEPLVGEYLHSFVDRSGGSMTHDMIRQDIEKGEFQAWTVLVDGRIAALALTLIKNDATKTCVISHCAGSDYRQWAGPLLATVAAWAEEVGSTKLEAVTRPGWAKVLRQFGMKTTHVVLELENGKQI